MYSQRSDRYLQRDGVDASPRNDRLQITMVPPRLLGSRPIIHQQVIVSASPGRGPHRISDPERHVERIGPATGGRSADPVAVGAGRGLPGVHVQRYHLGLVVAATGRSGFRGAVVGVVRSVHLVGRDRFVPHRPVLSDDHVFVVRVTERAARFAGASNGERRERQYQRDRRLVHGRSEWRRRRWCAACRCAVTVDDTMNVRADNGPRRWHCCSCSCSCGCRYRHRRRQTGYYIVLCLCCFCCCCCCYYFCVYRPSTVRRTRGEAADV